MRYEYRCKVCGAVGDRDVPVERRNDPQPCACGSTRSRTYGGIQTCTSTAADRFFGGNPWFNGREAADRMRAAEKRAEASWQPTGHAPEPGMTPLRRQGY